MVTLQGSLELQLYWVCHLQNLLKSEHNQQIMCEAGLPQQLIQRCTVAFSDEGHPLHAPLQRIFERLASQALTPTVLRCRGIEFYFMKVHCKVWLAFDLYCYK